MEPLIYAIGVGHVRPSGVVSGTMRQVEIDMPINVLTICGSLRKGSYNAALMRALPGLAPADMKLTQAPPFDSFPHYNADLQASDGFPPGVQALADVIRAADGVIFISPDYN